jgi:hypothetical protein
MASIDSRNNLSNNNLNNLNNENISRRRNRRREIAIERLQGQDKK